MFDKYRKINSLEDGNCAYNAVVLGFCDFALAGILDLNGEQGRYKKILGHLSLRKKDDRESDWQAFKNFIREKSPHELQRILAPIFREITISLYTPTNITNKAEAFSAEFRDHLHSSLNLRLDERFMGGDIFIRIPGIKNKFKETSSELLASLSHHPEFNYENLRNGHDKQCRILDEAIKKELTPLIHWFKTEGFKEYIEYMKKEYKWAGDIELGLIAEFLGLNIKTHQETHIYPIHNDYGSAPSSVFNPPLSLEDIQLLMDREIIDRQENTAHLFFLELDEAEVIQRLNLVESANIFHDFWSTFVKPDTKLVIPKNWQTLYKSSFAQLKQRQAIIKEHLLDVPEGEEDYFFPSTMKEDILFSKLQGFARKNEFIAVWKAYYAQQPTLMLSNPNAVHWYYMQPRDMMNHWDLSKDDVTPKPSMDGCGDEILKMLLAEASAFQNRDPLNDEESPGRYSRPKNFLLTHSTTSLFVPPSRSNSIRDLVTDSIAPNAFDLLFSTLDPNSSDKLYDELDDDDNPLEFDGDAIMSDLPVNADPEKDVYSYLQRNSLFKPSRALDITSSPTSPPQSSSPPHKKAKNDLAEEADKILLSLENLPSLMASNQPLHGAIELLKKKFRFIKNKSEIPTEESLILYNLKYYLELKGISNKIKPDSTETEIIEIPSTLTEFSHTHHNELLHKCKNDLRDEVVKFYMWFLRNVDKPPVAVVNLINEIFEYFHGAQTSLDKIRPKLTNFEINSIDKITTNEELTPRKLQKLKTLIEHCKFITNELRPQTSAQFIVELIKRIKCDSPPTEALLNAIANGDMRALDTNELHSLLDKKFQFDSPKVISELEYYVNLYKNELSVLNEQCQIKNAM